MRKAIIMELDTEKLRKEFRKFLEENGTSVTKFCKEECINVNVINHFLNANEWNPKVSSLKTILEILGYQLVVLKRIENDEDDRAE